MPLPYPQKQTLAVAILCGLAVAGAAAYAFGKSDSAPSAVSIITAPSAPGTATYSDVGSSTDWQKDFFANATGTPAIGVAAQGEDAAQPASSTLTDQMSKDFFARYIELKQNNLDSNQQLVQDTIDQTIDNATGAAKQPKKYVLSDITVSQDSSVSALKAYGNAVGSVFEKYAPTQTPVDIATNAFDQNDMSVLAGIDPIIAALNKMNSILLPLSVPAPLAQDHLDLVNAISSMIYVSQGLRDIQGDPMQAIVALGTYAQAQTDAVNALLNLQIYFKTSSISFSPDEPGDLITAITLPTD